MKAILTIYDSGNIIRVNNYNTKKQAMEFKRDYLRCFTVSQKVKRDIQIFIDKRY